MMRQTNRAASPSNKICFDHHHTGWIKTVFIVILTISRNPINQPSDQSRDAVDVQQPDHGDSGLVARSSDKAEDTVSGGCGTDMCAGRVII